jgi:hypothetical protein
MALSQISLRLENLSQAFVEAWKLDLAAGLLGAPTSSYIGGEVFFLTHHLPCAQESFFKSRVPLRSDSKEV